MKQTFPLTTTQRALLTSADEKIARATQSRHDMLAVILAGYDITSGRVVELTNAGLVVEEPVSANIESEGD